MERFEFSGSQIAFILRKPNLCYWSAEQAAQANSGQNADASWFLCMVDAQATCEAWRREYTEVRRAAQSVSKLRWGSFPALADMPEPESPDLLTRNSPTLGPN